MKIWFDKNDISTTFCSEQMVIAPYMPIELIKVLPDYTDVDTYIDEIRKTVVLVDDITSCDYLVFPKKLDGSHLFAKYVELSKKHSKKLLTFYNDDNSSPIADIANIIVYRTSFFKSKRKPFEFAMPAWSVDFKPHLTIREKRDVPVIGFCGFINHAQTDIRRRCLAALQNTKLQENFLIRNSFWGGAIHNSEVRSEYIRNIEASDFILCTRGAGNFSYRLYETLSMGRIPLFIDTDCVLPFEEIIPYSAYFPIVKEKEIDHLEQIILNFWSNLDYVDHQKRLRELYENHLSPIGFVRTLDHVL